jgi:hypothetical protein
MQVEQHRKDEVLDSSTNVVKPHENGESISSESEHMVVCKAFETTFLSLVYNYEPYFLNLGYF